MPTAGSVSVSSPRTPRMCRSSTFGASRCRPPKRSSPVPARNMPETRGPEERLQPALLDRLTDDEPGKKVEPREARVFSKRRLRQAVLRDLAWLFNATRLESTEDLSRTPLVRGSVVNFG